MGTIFKIFLRDVKHIIRNPIALIVIIGIAVLPSLYAWFNIAACWDPYGNTKGISVAVANLDEGVKMEGVTVNIGGMIIDNLAKNDQIGWQFVPQDNAMAGVDSGKYYAAVIIPADFSSKISSILSTDIEKPTIDYYVNQKKNAIAPKITDKGVSVVQQQINETFVGTVAEVIGTVLNQGEADLENAGVNLTNSMISALRESQQSLNTFSTTITMFESTISAIDSLLGTVQQTLPQGQQLAQGGVMVSQDVIQLLAATQNLTKDGLDGLDEASATVKALSGSVKEQLDSALLLVGTDSTAAARRLEQAEAHSETVTATTEQTAAILSAFNQKLPKPLAGLTALSATLDNAADKSRQLTGALGQARQHLLATGSLADSDRQTLETLWHQTDTLLADIHQTLDQSIIPQLEAVVDDAFSALDDLSTLLVTTGGLVPQIADTLTGTSSALHNTSDALRQADILLREASQEIGQTIARLEQAQDDQRLSLLKEIINNDPAVTASFMAAPVDVNTVNLYSIENYGSALSPFYTILCLWVGSLILVAILKCPVKEDENIKDIKPYQAYFGRYLIFLVIAIIQALIACAGDLYYLKIQCLNPGLYLLTGVLASIVFSNLIYTLTLSLSDVGKAIAVIALVIQVAGAGGTFPVEVMPAFFQVVNPMLPFTYGINAMRETVGGIYGSAYWIDIAKLLAYLPPSLFVGLCLRKPLIRFTRYFDEKLEETGLM